MSERLRAHAKAIHERLSIDTRCLDPDCVGCKREIDIIEEGLRAALTEADPPVVRPLSETRYCVNHIDQTHLAVDACPACLFNQARMMAKAADNEKAEAKYWRERAEKAEQVALARPQDTETLTLERFLAARFALERVMREGYLQRRDGATERVCYFCSIILPPDGQLGFHLSSCEGRQALYRDETAKRDLASPSSPETPA